MKQALTLIARLVIVQSASAALLFESDWSTATGNSIAALLDTNKALPPDSMNFRSSREIREIVPSAGLNFPTSNVLVTNLRFNFASAVNFGLAGANCKLSSWRAPGFDSNSVIEDSLFDFMQTTKNWGRSY
jgi:hypothetical protein